MKSLIVSLVLVFVCSWGWADDAMIDSLIPHIIQVESGGDPNAVSSKGAVGLMQITPVVFKEFKEESCFGDTRDGWVKQLDFHDIRGNANNIFIGTWYLNRLKFHYLKDRYTVERLLAAYNGGITRLRNVDYDVSKMPRETQRYVEKVMKLWKEERLCPKP